MLNKTLLLFFASIFVALSNLSGQDHCTVLKAEISDSYSGKCKKGLAHGIGQASGDHAYHGNFKNGLPHGKGKYTYENLDFYKGEWRNGMRHGNGKLVKASEGFDEENTRLGLWKNDEFVREIVPEVYKVVRKQNIAMLNVKKIDESANKIEYAMRNMREVNNFNYHSSSGIIDNVGNGRLVIKEPKFPVTVLIEYDVKTKLSSEHSNHVVVEIKFESTGNWKVRMGDS